MEHWPLAVIMWLSNFVVLYYYEQHVDKGDLSNDGIFVVVTILIVIVSSTVMLGYALITGLI